MRILRSTVLEKKDYALAHLLRGKNAAKADLSSPDAKQLPWRDIAYRELKAAYEDGQSGYPVIAGRALIHLMALLRRHKQPTFERDLRTHYLYWSYLCKLADKYTSSLHQYYALYVHISRFTLDLISQTDPVRLAEKTADLELALKFSDFDMVRHLSPIQVSQGGDENAAFQQAENHVKTGPF